MRPEETSSSNLKINDSFMNKRKGDKSDNHWGIPTEMTSNAQTPNEAGRANVKI